MLPINTDVLLVELDSASKILLGWQKRITEGGIPGQDYPVPDERHIDDFVRKLAGELMLVAHKCDALARILTDQTS